jgi:hypothetical protein
MKNRRLSDGMIVALGAGQCHGSHVGALPRIGCYVLGAARLGEGGVLNMNMSKRIICEHCPETFEVEGTGSGPEVARTVFCGRCYGENTMYRQRCRIRGRGEDGWSIATVTRRSDRGSGPAPMRRCRTVAILPLAAGR